MVDLASSRDTLKSSRIAVGSGGTSDESCSVGHAVRWRRGSRMGPHPSFLSRRWPRRLGYPFDDHVRDRAELREHGRVGAGTRHGSCQRNDRRPGTKSETVPRPIGLAQRRDGGSKLGVHWPAERCLVAHGWPRGRSRRTGRSTRAIHRLRQSWPPPAALAW